MSMNIIKKENLTIVVGEYTNNQGETKKRYRTIGELITGDSGSGAFQFGSIWGPHGETKFNVYAQEDRQQKPAPTKQSAPPPVNDFDEDIPF